MSNLQVGQRLWCVFRIKHGRRLPVPAGENVTVVKVGRKYAELSNGERLFVGNMKLDGRDYSSPGECYANEAVFDAAAGAELAWTSLANAMSACVPPAGVTSNDVAAARALLKL